MLRLVLIISLLVYPFLVYFTLPRFGPVALSLLLCGMLLVRLYLARWPARYGLLGLAALLIFTMAVSLTGNEQLLKSYPVGVNLLLMLLFAGSLVYQPTIIERGLRAAHREVPVHATKYLWWVTFVWAVFFLCSAAIAAWTAYFGSLKAWTLYNGLLSYVLVGLLFLVEYCVRIVYRRRVESYD